MKTCLYARNEQVDLVLELDEQGRQIKFAADESFKAKIKCRAAGEVKQAMVHSVDGVSACSVGHIDGGIEIEISNHRVFSVVLFDRKSA